MNLDKTKFSFSIHASIFGVSWNIWHCLTRKLTIFIKLEYNLKLLKCLILLGHNCDILCFKYVKLEISSRFSIEVNWILKTWWKLISHGAWVHLRRRLSPMLHRTVTSEPSGWSRELSVVLSKTLIGQTSGQKLIFR